MSRFSVMTHIPGTAERAYYRSVVSLVDKVTEMWEQMFPDSLPFPKPIPRDQASCLLAIETMGALLHSMKAAFAGGDPAAVFGEHMPTPPSRSI